MTIRVISPIWNDSYVAFVDDEVAPDVFKWRRIAWAEAQGTTVIWDVTKPLGYDDEVRYTHPPHRS